MPDKCGYLISCSNPLNIFTHLYLYVIELKSRHKCHQFIGNGLRKPIYSTNDEQCFRMLWPNYMFKQTKITTTKEKPNHMMTDKDR